MNLFGMKKHRIRSLWLLLLLLTCSVTVWAQGSSVTGRVSDEKGELLIGVSVQEKGTTNGTITDMNGQYTLKLSTGNPILLISYIGYKPQEVKVAKQKIVDVVLVEDVSSLDEVVVVGYGNQRKVSVVGAQSTMDVKDIKMPAASLSSAISGRIAGVVAVQRSGEPGHDESDIWIRGLSSLLGQSSSPLVLVDGVERSFNNIDPEDIESFTVLKDASATAVYGVRGANGVVIVKTKPGKVGKPQFSVDYYESFTRLTKKVDMADAYTYMDARNEAQMNTSGTLKYSAAYIEATKKANGYGEEKYGVNVTWSKSRKQDLGIDIKFLNDNLSFVVDFFKERRDNIFLQRSTIPSYAGWIENPYANLGVVENKGIELAMDYTQRLGKKTFLTVRGNLTFNKDKIIENDEPPVDYPWMETRGTNVNATWGFIADGLFTSQAEIEDHATQFGTVHVGDIKYRDLNGDGVIDNYDKTVIGRGDVPRIYYGFGADLQIGDFSISALFQGTGQADRYLDGICIKPFWDDEGRDNVFANIHDRWSPDDPTNQDVFYPRMYVGSDANTNNVQKSSWWVKDVSFLRLKQLNISYNIPKKLLDRCFLKSASVYLMGTNLLTFSNFKLWDPELNSSNGTAYPNVSSYSVGVKFSF